MFEAFVRAFPADTTSASTKPWHEPRLVAAHLYSEFSDLFAGRSFGRGLYRFHDADSGPRAATLIDQAFPKFAAEASPFGYDWLGRQFGLTSREDCDELVLMFEPGTGEVLEVPFTFDAFHHQLDNLREPALASTFFDEWARENPSAMPIARTSCVGYSVPLLLGGADNVENLELVDLEIYWSLSAQMLTATRDLPPGTPIRGISIDS